jgi:hypothetical protein
MPTATGTTISMILTHSTFLPRPCRLEYQDRRSQLLAVFLCRCQCQWILQQSIFGKFLGIVLTLGTWYLG